MSGHAAPILRGVLSFVYPKAIYGPDREVPAEKSSRQWLGTRNKPVLVSSKKHLRENCQNDFTLFAQVSQKPECSVASNIAERSRELV